MRSTPRAFTLIEAVFIVLIIGILVSIAVGNFSTATGYAARVSAVDQVVGAGQGILAQQVLDGTSVLSPTTVSDALSKAFPNDQLVLVDATTTPQRGELSVAFDNGAETSRAAAGTRAVGVTVGPDGPVVLIVTAIHPADAGLRESIAACAVPGPVTSAAVLLDGTPDLSCD